MSDYQNRKDIDTLYDMIYDKEHDEFKFIDRDVFNELIQKLGFNQVNSNKFNFAVITKVEDGLEYQEFWILSNAYYNYETNLFYKIEFHIHRRGVAVR